MTLTAISSLEAARKNFSWTRGTSCLESGNQTFLGSGGRNDSNTHQFARISEKKFFYELDVHHTWKVGIKRFWAQEAEMTLTPISSLESARKNFSWTRGTSCPESGNQTFLGSGGRNDSNTHQFARSSEKKIFYELDVHHVWKVGIKRFWAHEAEMTLTPISSLESGRKNFFINSTYIMSWKWESNVFGLRRPKWL